MFKTRSYIEQQIFGALFILSSMIISGCATNPNRMYDGPKLEKDEVAVISCTGLNNVIYAIDGKKAHAQKNEILPGEHTVTLSVAQKTLNLGTVRRDLTFVAEAGRQYSIVKLRLSQVDRGGNAGERFISGAKSGFLASFSIGVKSFVWIADDSGEVVAGYAPKSWSCGLTTCYEADWSKGYETY